MRARERRFITVFENSGSLGGNSQAPQVWLKPRFLAILTPGMRALFASEELSRRFVSAPSLEEPPERCVVSALWAFNVRGRHGLYPLFLLATNLHFRTRVFFDLFRPSDC